MTDLTTEELERLVSWYLRLQENKLAERGDLTLAERMEPMTEFGLIIDELGVPGLHPSVEDAKLSAEQEIRSLWHDIYDTSGWVFDWRTALDAGYERVTIYTDETHGYLAPVSDDYLEWQLWSVTLWNPVNEDG